MLGLIMAYSSQPLCAQSKQVGVEAAGSDVAKFLNPEQFLILKREWEKDIKITVGMTVTALKDYIAKNNVKVNKAKPPAWVTDKFHLPAFAYPELRLHVFVDMNSPKGREVDVNPEVLSYWVNGRTQFWMDLAIENDKVKNIYITFGNGSVQLPPIKLAGTGHHLSAVLLKKAEQADDGVRDK